MSDCQNIIDENKKLSYKVEKLENKVEYLGTIIEKKKLSNEKMFTKYTQRGREINRLKRRIEWLETQLGISQTYDEKE